MSVPDTTLTEKRPPSTLEADETLRALRSVILLIIASILLLTGTVFIYLYREVILIRRQSGELARVVLEYEKTSWPQMQFFKKTLQAFATTNADFAPILGKYFGTNEMTQPNLGDLPSPASQVAPR